MTSITKLLRIDLQQFSFGATGVLLACLPLPMQFFNTALVSILAVRFLFFKPQFSIRHDAVSWVGFAMIGYFITEAISLLYTTNLDQGLSALERKLSFVVVPLFFFSTRKQLAELDLKPLLKKYLYYFLWLMVVLYLYALVRFVDIYIEQQWLEENFFTIELPFLLGMSHVYFGLYAVFAMSVGYWILLTEPQLSVGTKRIILAVLSLSFLSMVLITAKSALVAAVIVTMYFLRCYGLRRVGVRSVVVVILVGLGLLSVLMIYSKNVRYRLSSSLNFTENTLKNSPEDYKTARMVPLLCSRQLLANMPVWGYGAGDVQALLNHCYVSKGFDRLENLNPHNQFIKSALGGGYVQLLCLIYLYFGLLSGFGTKQPFLIRSFGILFLVCSMTESLLERNKGIVLFCFGTLLLHSIFASSFTSSQSSSNEQ